MALIDFLKSPLFIADEALAEKFDYEPVGKKVTNLIPSNIRQFIYDAYGGKEDFTEKDLSDAVAKYGFTAVEPKLFKLIKEKIWNGGSLVMYQVLRIVDGGLENSLYQEKFLYVTSGI